MYTHLYTKSLFLYVIEYKTLMSICSISLVSTIHVLNDKIRNNSNSVKNCAKHLNFCMKLTGGMSSKTIYTIPNIYFSYVSTHI